MPYQKVDDLISKLDILITTTPGGVDPYITSNIAALIAVVSVATFERRIKDILCNYSKNQNAVFGVYVNNNLQRINGRISISDMKGQYLGKFGQNFVDKFVTELDNLKKNALSQGKPDPADNYGNLLNARHDFLHVDNPKLPDYEEIKNFYLSGKEITSALEQIFT